MVEKKSCSFCGEDIEPGTGKMMVKNNGTRLRFCSSKCEKNYDLDRDAKKINWIHKEE